MRKIFLIFAIIFCLQDVANAFVVPKTPTGYVNDYAGMLSDETKQYLENYLKAFTASTSNEIAVVTIPDLGGDTVEHYANSLFELWKIGKADNDNGILLLIARDEHKLRIEVGYGLEGALPDILAKDVIDTKITSLFKQGKYDDGVMEGVTAIMDATKGEYKVEEISQNNFSVNGNILELIFIFLVFGLQFISSILARSKSWWAGGIIGGVIGYAVTYFSVFGMSILAGSIITFVLVILGLLFDYVVSSTYTNSISRGNSIPWWVGGGGSGGHSSSSFGGFGGGSSGGGGASGSW